MPFLGLSTYREARTPYIIQLLNASADFLGEIIDA